jgi:hypothetical protein
VSHAYSTAVGDKVRYDPGMSYGRVELFHATFPSAGPFDLKIGGPAIGSIDGNAPVSFTRRVPIGVARTSGPIDQVVTGGTAWPGVLRVWDSTAPRKLQVENLGVCSYRSSE